MSIDSTGKMSCDDVALPETLIVFPTRGERIGWLRDCVRSVKVQGVSAQLVVVGPKTADLTGFCRSEGLEYIEDPGRGLSAAINCGWSCGTSATKYLTWLGDDDLLAPGSLGLMMTTLKNAPEAAFAYGRTRYIDSSGTTIYISIPTRFAPRYMKVGKDFIPQPGSLIRAEAITWTPPLDESLRNAMDLDLFLRLSCGPRSRWAYVPVEVSAYRLHGGAITHNKGAADESEAVKERYRSRSWSQIAHRTATIRNFVERLLIWLQWHAPVRERTRSSGWYCAANALAPKSR